MKTNSLLDSIRENTSEDVKKRVDMCVSISNRIYELLETQGLSQRDFARKLGKTETEVSRWLSGTHNLTIATIAKMAVVLGDDIIITTELNQNSEDVCKNSNNTTANSNSHLIKLPNLQHV